MANENQIGVTQEKESARNSKNWDRALSDNWWEETLIGLRHKELRPLRKKQGRERVSMSGCSKLKHVIGISNRSMSKERWTEGEFRGGQFVGRIVQNQSR